MFYLLLHVLHHIYFSSGAAAGLYEESYYASMKAALRPCGIICCQGQPIKSCTTVKKKTITVNQTQYQTQSVRDRKHQYNMLILTFIIF